MSYVKEIFWNIFFSKDLAFVEQHYIPSKELEIIRQLEAQVEMLEEIYENTEEDFIEEKLELIDIIENLNEEIRVLKNSDDNTVRPELLEISSSVFKPRTRISTKVGDKVITLNPTDIYSSSAAISRIVAQNGLKDLYLTDKKACAMEIWKVVVSSLRYEYDKEEDWRYSPISLAYGKGDCEDGTILFLDLAKEAGFKSDEIFNATGYVTTSSGNFGHSYPLVNCGDGWFIYESTLNSVPSSGPMKFEDSNYTADWGLANWRYEGKIIDALQI